MQMMYEIIAREIRAMNLENVNPQDYLNFYCLGNREEMPFDEKYVSNSGEMVKILFSMNTISLFFSM